MLEMKTSTSQIQTTVDSIISRKDQTEERISEIEEKIKELLHTNHHKEKMSTKYKNSDIQSKRQTIHSVEEGVEYKLKS
jgi:TolA-binding protein